MKTTTYGTTRYIVTVYYHDSDNNFQVHYSCWHNKSCAKSMQLLYSKYIGRHAEFTEFQGIVGSVYVLKARPCKFVE